MISIYFKVMHPAGAQATAFANALKTRTRDRELWRRRSIPLSRFYRAGSACFKEVPAKWRNKGVRPENGAVLGAKIEITEWNDTDRARDVVCEFSGRRTGRSRSRGTTRAPLMGWNKKTVDRLFALGAYHNSSISE
jgi:hypothetical protein